LPLCPAIFDADALPLIAPAAFDIDICLMLRHYASIFATAPLRYFRYFAAHDVATRAIFC